ncbi:membrane protein [Streptomyces cinereospinus]
MSDHQNGTPDQPTGGGPRPEPLRFFGTTWVGRDSGYTARRIAVSAGSLAAATAACLVLRFAYEGIQLAETGVFVPLLVVVMFAVCSPLAFRHTWEGFTRRHDPDRQSSLRSLLTIGFVGSLLAYFCRSLTEAPARNSPAPSTKRPSPSTASAPPAAPATPRKRPRRA